MTTCTVEISVGVVHGDGYEKPHDVIYYVAQLFTIVFHLPPTPCAAKGPDIYFTVRKCQLFNWRRFQDRAKKGLKCLQLTFRNSCRRQYLVFYCVICGPLGNEKVKSRNCFFPFSVKELQASLSLKVKLI